MEQEEYPGQQDEIRRRQIIRDAVTAADNIIMERTSGSVQETDYLTMAVAQEFTEKVNSRISAELLKHDLLERHGREHKTNA